jgi:hypothetical protein
VANKKYIVGGKVYEETSERKVIVGGKVLEETTAAAAPLSNDRISSMHFQKMWEPTALGE